MPSYSTPEGKYYQQSLQAKQRGIPWEFTFDKWWAVWQASGKWDQRGPRIGQYVMARRGDVGFYSEENVVICTSTANRKQAHLNGCCDPFKSLGTGRGWTFRPGRTRPYQVNVRGKFVGAHYTQEEAEAAYQRAVEDVLRMQAGEPEKA